MITDDAIHISIMLYNFVDNKSVLALLKQIESNSKFCDIIWSIYNH